MEEPTVRHHVHRPPHGAAAVAGPRYDVPHGYRDNQVTLLVRDPQCVYAFWDVTGVSRTTSSLVLRVYDLTNRDHERWDGARYADFVVGGTTSWYVHTETPGLVLGAAIGVRQRSEFVPLARSNVVATPPGRISDETDAEWMSVEQLYRSLAHLPVGSSSAALAAPLE